MKKWSSLWNPTPEKCLMDLSSCLEKKWLDRTKQNMNGEEQNTSFSITTQNFEKVSKNKTFSQVLVLKDWVAQDRYLGGICTWNLESRELFLFKLMKLMNGEIEPSCGMVSRKETEHYPDGVFLIPSASEPSQNEARRRISEWNEWVIWGGGILNAFYVKLVCTRQDCTCP